MKKRKLIIGIVVFSVMQFACNDNTVTTTEETNMSSDSGSAVMDSISIATSAVNTIPLTMEDSSFVMESAMGGRMEAEFANFAQARSKNLRVKDFAAMLLRDHTQANQELKNLATSKNINLGDTLGNTNEGHLQKLLTAGVDFDKTYIKMMVDDHKETIRKFEEAAIKVKDPQLKSWVEKTLPSLKVHRDSAVAISKAKL